MPSMIPLPQLDILFFKAEKKYYKPVNRYFVEGDPNANGLNEQYAPFKKDFQFRTYKEVIVGGILWTKRLFGSTNVNDIYAKHLEYGKKKQWINTQLVHTDKGVVIDGEKFNPYVNISFSYNTVTKIKLEIGFYRTACSNGLVSGFTELSKMDIKPEKLFEIPFWVNPCLLTALSKRLEWQIQILKRTSLKVEHIRQWIYSNVSNWEISEDLIYRYNEELGENAYALLNILSDRASNLHAEGFDNGSIVWESGTGSERALRQRKIGLFLESLVESIIKENQWERHSNYADINSPDFIINNENIGQLDTIRIRESYKFDIGKIKF